MSKILMHFFNCFDYYSKTYNALCKGHFRGRAYTSSLQIHNECIVAWLSYFYQFRVINAN